MSFTSFLCCRYRPMWRRDRGAVMFRWTTATTAGCLAVVALVATATTLVAVAPTPASAFALVRQPSPPPHRQHHRRNRYHLGYNSGTGSHRIAFPSSSSSSSSSFLMFLRPWRVECQASSNLHHHNNRAAALTSSSSSSSSSTSMTTEHERGTLMPIPPRGQRETHAIFGSLMRQGKDPWLCIESYKVYKQPKQQPQQPSGAGPVVVVAHIQLGRALDGHAGTVHGGILALLIDDVLGFAYEALEDEDEDDNNKHGSIPFAVTANLNVNYRSAVPTGAAICIQASLMERKERKLVWNVRVVDSQDDGVVYCEASSVYVIPRNVHSVAVAERNNNDNTEKDACSSNL